MVASGPRVWPTLSITDISRHSNFPCRMVWVRNKKWERNFESCWVVINMLLYDWRKGPFGEGYSFWIDLIFQKGIYERARGWVSEWVRDYFHFRMEKRKWNPKKATKYFRESHLPNPNPRKSILMILMTTMEWWWWQRKRQRRWWLPLIGNPFRFGCSFLFPPNIFFPFQTFLGERSVCLSSWSFASPIISD